MSGAGGRPKLKHFKRRMIVGGRATGDGETATESDDKQPPAVDDAAPANPANPPAKKASKARGGSGGAKAQ
jgi:hypothetical protein